MFGNCQNGWGSFRIWIACVPFWPHRVNQTDPEVRPMIECQLSGRAKYFRPVTAFACWRAMSDNPLPQELLHSVAGIELLAQCQPDCR